uniref:Uncharacterized protein LOC113785401 n=1 Tax=Cicer arietinum TaxID=3827 RepID=A0A3Q7YCL1_CICAR|nr:uncharacterized protein LOC113785401 [Cicer arietinum]
MEQRVAINGKWTHLWKLKRLCIIQTFMWLVAHERFLTIYCRSRWSVGVSPTCFTCKNGDETTDHILKDCVHATQVWIRHGETKVSLKSDLIA